MTNLRNQRWIQLGIVLLLLLGVGSFIQGEAKANTLIPELDSVVNTAPGVWTWTYSVILTGGAKAVEGDFVTIYDFAGYIPGSVDIIVNPGLWSFMLHFVGDTPPGVAPTDNPALPNLTFTYIGQNPRIGADLPIMRFTADSTNGNVGIGMYSSFDTKHSPGNPSDNTKASAIGDVELPVPAVPEPGSLLLLGSVLVGMGLIRRSV